MIIIINGLKVFGIFLLFSVFMSGCGESHSAGPAGVYVDTTTEDFLKKTFEETKACTQFPEGQFEDLSVILMPPNFPCKHYEGGCSGEFAPPNYIKVGSMYIWRHEVIHYLLKINTGDPDASHQSPLFNTCVL